MNPLDLRTPDSLAALSREDYQAVLDDAEIAARQLGADDYARLCNERDDR